MLESIPSLKQALRKEFLKRRREMPSDEWQQKSQQICEHLQASSLFKNAQTVLAYFSFRQEPDLSALFNIDKNWGFPRCEEKSLIWHSWSYKSFGSLQKGTYGILEPSAELPLIDPSSVDLLLVPAVACDAEGYRLGYGGGFYDRLLSTYPWSTRTTIGILFDFARLPELPHDEWDKPLHAVCSETGLVTYA